MQGFFLFVARRRGLVLALAALLAIGGVVNLRGLSIDAVPDISPKQVMVLTQAKGLGPLEAERLVTFPIENAMAGVPDMETIRSTSRFGLSAVYVTFRDGVDVNVARTLVAERLKLAEASMPPGVGTPQMGPVATGLGEVYQFQVVGPGYTPMQLRRILQWQIAPKLKLVPGVTDVNIYGGQLETFEVQIHADALRRYGLTLQQVFDAVRANNAARGGAYIDHDDEQQIVRGLGLVKDPKDLGDIVLATGPGGIPITVSTVGAVVRAPMVRLGAVTHDGVGETVVGVALMLYGDNASDVVTAVKAEVAKLGPQLPPGVAIKPYYDRSALVDRTIHTVEHNLLEGAILVIAVLLFTLGDIRAGLIVASAIPLSMLIAFAGMRFFGISANLMSLGAIDFGLIVDGAVVMVDNVLSRSGRSHDPEQDDGRGRRRGGAAGLLRRDHHRDGLCPDPVAAGHRGQDVQAHGRDRDPGAAGIAAAHHDGHPGPCRHRARPVEEAARRDLARARRCAGSTRRRWTSAPLIRCRCQLATVAIFGVSVFLAMGLGGEFIPQLSEGSIVVTSEKLPGINLDASLRTVTAIEKVIRSFPEVTSVVSLTGSAEIPTDPMGVESTDSFIGLKPRAQWGGAAADQDELVGQIDKALSDKVPGVAFTFSQPIQMRMEDLLQGVKADVGILIYGDDLGTLHRLADDVTKVVSGIKGAADVKPEETGGMPYMTIRVNREAVARYGMNVGEVLNVIDAIGGHEDGTVYQEDNSETSIMVRWPASDRSGVEAIRNLPVFDGAGRVMPLSELAFIDVKEGPAQISREALQRRTTVSVNLRGTDAASFVKAAQAAVAARGEAAAGLFG